MNRSELLDRVAVDDLDLPVARARLRRRERRSTQQRRTVVASVLLLVAMCGTLWAVLRPPSPDDVVAGGGDRSTTTTTSAVGSRGPTTTTTASVPDSTADPVAAGPPEVTPPAPVVPVAPSVTPPSAPTSPAPPTPGPVAGGGPPPAASPQVPLAAAPNHPMALRVEPPGAPVSIGGAVSLLVRWLDPDHTGAPVGLVVDSGDPLLAPVLVPASGGDCTRPGAAGAAAVPVELRYVTPGRHRATVTAATCGGRGEYAETVVAVAEVEVAPRGGSGVVVVRLGPSDGASEVPPLAEAVPVVRSEEGEEVPLEATPWTLRRRDPPGAALALVLPAGRTGTLELSWEGSACSASGPYDTSGPLPVEVRAELSC